MPTTSQKPAVEKSEADPVPYRVQQRGAQVSGHGKIYDVVAISDADTSGPPKDYRFRAGADEREELQAKMQTLAQKALAAYLKAAPPQTSAASRTARKVPVPALEDVRFEMFDLDSNNAAELVFSARQSQPAGGNAYVTVVARTDINNNPRQIFSHVTIDRDLDVKPRLELVDAVDLLADGSAELLFRETGADGSDFIIYRVGPDGLEQVFRGASAD
jgi:hypothetical protein